MPYDSETAAIRFGTGLSPVVAPPVDVADLLGRLTGPDAAAARFAIARFAEIDPTFGEIKRLSRLRRQAKGTKQADAAAKQIRKFRRTSREWQANWLNAAIRRGIHTEDGLRERLTRFWADHFTVEGKQGVARHVAATYVEEAIRPNITGRFADLLKAAVLHPMMLVYLDQYRSAGPHSVAARKRNMGLNENLAREVLELHALGVDGGYGQDDVLELAELLAGLSYRPGEGFVYKPGMAEPGAEVVLGKSYGGRKPKLADVYRFLEDLALQPDTARHLARKLAVHFIADDPDEQLVNHVAGAYLHSGGALMAAYGALLEHPAAWVMPDRKIKQPVDFVISSLRAIGVEDNAMAVLKPKDILLLLAAPMRLMGQAWEDPTGPDGWPEEAAAWITPQGLAGRIQWAMTVPGQLRPHLPDPRDLVETALAARAGKSLRFAVAGAEAKREGLGLILVSPEFQRR